MPGNDGKLTPDEIQTIIAWLNAKGGGNRPCPVCNNPGWSVGSHLVTGTIFRSGGLMLGGEVYPQFFVTCTNCFYTRHFMANPVLKMRSAEEMEKDKKAAEERAKAGGHG